jgi:NAD(P)-dependent dehydrogenase (short-subunit alcohol dehydrogenase family)
VSLSPATVVIAGLNARTGVAVAARFLRGGWSVIGTVRRPEVGDETTDAVVAAAGGGRDRLSIQSLDLADAASVEGFAATAIPSVIDALIVTGAPFAEGDVENVRVEDLVGQAAVQAAGPATLAIRLAPRLAASTRTGGSAVVLFGDIHARLRPRPGALPYLAGKAMLESLVPLLAVELAPIRIFGVAPGVIAWADGFDEARRASYLARVPLGRAGTLEEAAGLVESMVSEMTYTTGVVIPIDGGRSLR